MYLFLILSLVLNVLFDHVLVAVLPHGVEIEAARPEVAAPEHAFHFRMTSEDLSGREALDRSDQARGRTVGTDWIRKCTWSSSRPISTKWIS